jgi:hypothetical protein
MISMAPTLPPMPNESAIQGAMALLTALGNAADTQATLDKMAEAKKEIDDAIVANNAVVREATEAQTALADLQERERLVTAREQAVSSAQTALDVASSANAARAQSLDDREVELVKREQEHQARVKANEDRIASVRASLA